MAFGVALIAAGRKKADSSWLIVALFFLALSVIASQMTAAAMGYNPALDSLFRVSLGHHCYMPFAWGVWAFQFSVFSSMKYSPTVNAMAFAAIAHGLKFGSIFAVPVAFGGAILAGSRPGGGRVLKAVKPTFGNLVIKLGRSTGTLWDLGAKSGIRKGQDVCLVGDDAFQHVLVLGGTGAGKNLAGLNRIIRQLFRQSAGALILNVNGIADAEILAIAAKTGRKVRIIGIGGERVNLLDGLLPPLASANLSSVMLLADNSPQGLIWNTTATNWARAVLWLLWFVPEHYTLPAIFRFLYKEDFRNDIIARITERVEQFKNQEKTETDPAKLAEIKGYLNTIEGSLQEVANREELDKRISQSVDFMLTSVLANMKATAIEDAFFVTSGGASPLDLESTYRDGTIIVVNAGIQSHGLASQAILAFFKCRFFNTMETRPATDMKRPVAFIADEYQDVAVCSPDGRGDHNFFAKARRTRTTCILATQSLHSLIAKVGPDMARAIIANMRTRLVFRSEDDLTIESMLKLLGNTEVERESSGKSRAPGGTSTSTNTQHAVQPVAHAELFRNLRKFRAVLIASIGNESADDVVICKPEFLT